MTDPAMPPHLERLLDTATVPAMSAGLIDRIVAEAQRPGRVALCVTPPRRAHARVWTRLGVRTGIVAVSMMLATAVAAMFGGGAFSVAKIRAVAQHVIDRVRHPFPHAAPVVVPARPITHRLAVPPEAIRLAPARIASGVAPHAVVPPITLHPIPGRASTTHLGARAPLLRPAHAERLRPFAQPHARFAAHASARRAPGRSPGIRHPPPRQPGPDRALVATPIEPREGPSSSASAAKAPLRSPEIGLRADGTRIDGSSGRDPFRFGNATTPRGPGWRRRMVGRGDPGDVEAGAPSLRRRGAPAGGMRMKPYGAGGRRRPRRF